jgi:hypothetical protein
MAQHAGRGEVVELVWQRINSVCPEPDFADTEYRRGLEAAVQAAVDWAMTAARRDGGEVPPVPPALLVQARVAARNRVSLDSVVRRYVVGHTVVLRVLLEEDGLDCPASSRTQLLSELLDEVVQAVSREHERESRQWGRSNDQLWVGRIKDLLAGDLRGIDRFTYDFNGAQVGLMGTGRDAGLQIKLLTKALDCQSLLVYPGPTSVWAWLASREGIDWGELERWLGENWPPDATLAVGEEHRGLVGWRRTHREARAASSIAEAHPGRAIRYGREALRVAATNDDLLGATLRDRYVVPLDGAGVQAPAIKGTLAAYLSSEWNATSVSEQLGVSRKTVNSRIRVAETLIGQSLPTCASALQVALALDADDREAAEGEGK